MKSLIIFTMTALSLIAQAEPKIEVVTEAREVVVNRPEDVGYQCFPGHSGSFPTDTMVYLMGIGKKFPATTVEDIHFNAGRNGNCTQITEAFQRALPLKLRINRTVSESCELNQRGETLLTLDDELKATVGELTFTHSVEMIVGFVSPDKCRR